MARAGLGGDARADDVGVGNQHHGAVLDEEEVLTTDLTDLKTGFTRIFIFVLFVPFCG
jgi:hypothetical protein